MKRLVLFSLVVLTFRVQAAPLNPNNILVSIGQSAGSVQGDLFTQFNSVGEFTPNGEFVQQLDFNYDNRSYPDSEFLRDIVVDQYGSIIGYNGTNLPFVTRCSPESNTFTHVGFAGWNTYLGVTGGAIAAFQNYVFVSDDRIIYGYANGIIRYDRDTDTWVRFANGQDFGDLNVDLAGKLYALKGNEVNVYDPTS